VVSPDKDHKPKYTERLNGPIQSTAGDILYLTLEKLAADPHPGTHFLLSVHDELVLECPEEDARGVALWLKAKMREAMEEILGGELGGPKCAEVGYGPSWGECVELEESMPAAPEHSDTRQRGGRVQVRGGPTLGAP
jgi:DNA polymerase I-like protein with 3'-5' exonuclease and polymerase domains